MERIAEALNVTAMTISRDIADFNTMLNSNPRPKTARNPRGAGRPKGSQHFTLFSITHLMARARARYTLARQEVIYAVADELLYERCEQAPLRVVQGVDGWWRIEIGPVVAGEHLTNAEAWRLAERLERRPLSRPAARWKWGDAPAEGSRADTTGDNPAWPRHQPMRCSIASQSAQFATASGGGAVSSRRRVS